MKARLDLFGVLVLALVVALAGGIIRDLLIGVPPATFRDWRYLAAAGAAGLATFVARPLLERLWDVIQVLDAAGLALFCVTGSATALAFRLGPAQAILLGAITGIGGGMLRDVLLRQVPTVLQHNLYAVPALIGASVVVIAHGAGAHSAVFPLIGFLLCLIIRILGLRFDIQLPTSLSWQASKGGGSAKPGVTGEDAKPSDPHLD